MAIINVTKRITPFALRAVRRARRPLGRTYTYNPNVGRFSPTPPRNIEAYDNLEAAEEIQGQRILTYIATVTRRLNSARIRGSARLRRFDRQVTKDIVKFVRLYYPFSPTVQCRTGNQTCRAAANAARAWNARCILVRTALPTYYIALRALATLLFVRSRVKTGYFRKSWNIRYNITQDSSSFEGPGALGLVIRKAYKFAPMIVNTTSYNTAPYADKVPPTLLRGSPEQNWRKLVE